MSHASSPSLGPSVLPQRPHSAPPTPAGGSHEHGEQAALVVPAVTPLPGRSAASSFLESSTQKFKQGLTEAQATATDLSLTISQAVLDSDLARDLRDRRREVVGKDSLCERCKQFCISDWLNAGQADAAAAATAQVWETPLERIIRLSDWCKFCRFLLHTLSQPQNDPLRNRKVAAHVPQEILGITMAQLVQFDWELIDMVWPFGRTDQPGNHSTYALGRYQEKVVDVANYSRTWQIAASLFSAGFAVFKGKQQQQQQQQQRSKATARSSSPDYFQGNASKYLKLGKYIQKASQVRYRKQCLLRVSLRKNGALIVDCRGHTGLQNSQMEVLSRFRLHVADNQGPSPPLHDTKSPQSQYSRKVDSRWIDVSVAKQWLCECETKHGTKCSRHGWEVARDSPEYLRVIDVYREVIVVFDNPTSCRYIALSYMWGGFKGLLLTSSNIATLTEDGGLRRYVKDIPRTILDAMEVVKAMGERYLWVDALCKLQETETDTAETKERAKLETRLMDRVYGGALVTLVAASGTHANAGLQGVQRDGGSTERSVHQESAEIQGTLLFAPLSGGQDLESTPWNGRGWTFQERLLSRRIIAFADNELVWYCHAMTCREDTPSGKADDDGIRPLQALTLKPSWFSGSGGTGKNTIWVDGSLETNRFGMTHLMRSGRFSEYIKAVQQYKHRQLTHQDDILDAFAGLSSIFERSFQARSLFGLLEIVFDVSLLWRPEGQLNRRNCGSENFPSWSWAGWEGAVCYDKPLTISRNEDGVITGYTTSTQNEGEEGIRPLLRWHIWNADKRCFEPINGNLGRGFPVSEGGFPREWDSNAFGGKKHPHQLLPEGSVDLELLRPYHLMFSTSSVRSFRLGPPMDQAGKDRSQSRHVVLSARGGPAGAVTLDGLSASDEDRHGEQREFIVLAESHHLHRNGQVGEFEDYLVMLVVQLGDTGIYERLGLGHISKTRWAAGEPEIKTVVLG